MEVTNEFPKLYGLASTGKIKEWRIWVSSENGVGFIYVSHGLQNGKKQLDVVEVTVGKNIGKSNETTPVEQAVSQAESKWNGKKDKGYSEDVNNIPVDKLPMLAKRYKDSGKHIKFPCFVQPKLNGVRCLIKNINGKMDFSSRKGKKYLTLEHIGNELINIINSDIFDGEVFVRGEAFQDILSAVRNVKHKEDALLDCRKLEYWLYDIADKTMDFKDRTEKLRKLKCLGLKNIVIVSTYEAYDEADIDKYHKQFTNDGYEGTIIRNQYGGYEFDHRSDNLQKKKDFLDEEFKIVGVKCGVGRYKNCATFICETVDGKTFDVCPKGTVAKKEQYWADGNKNVGELLTVQYQEKSKDGIPIFPVGLAIRDYE